MSKSIPSIDQIDRLLIVKTSSIGDIVHALPVVEAIKRANPKVTLDWLVRRRCAGVLAGNPNIDVLHVINDKPSVGDLLKLRRELHSRRYACALDMQGLFLSGLFSWLSGAPIRIGLDRNREGNALFMTHPVVSGKVGAGHADRHAVDILYGFAEVLGIHSEHPEFNVQSYLASGGVGDFAQSLNTLPRPVVGLNVGASSLYKRWPIDHWIVLANSLLAEGYGLAFVGDSKDAETVAEITSKLPPDAKFANVSGRTSLRELAAVLETCKVLVTGDTGPMHLAVAVGTSTIALFGATNPDRTGPYGKRNIVLNMHLDCSPCYRTPTCNGRVDCMRAIEVGMVVDRVKEMVGAATHA